MRAPCPFSSISVHRSPGTTRPRAGVCFSLAFFPTRGSTKVVISHKLARGVNHTPASPAVLASSAKKTIAELRSCLCAHRTRPLTPIRPRLLSTVGSGLFTTPAIVQAMNVRAAETTVRPQSRFLSSPHASGHLHCEKICLAKKAGARRMTLMFLPRRSTYAPEAPEAPPTLNTLAKLGSSPLFASFAHPAAHTRLSELPKTLPRLA